MTGEVVVYSLMTCIITNAVWYFKNCCDINKFNRGIGWVIPLTFSSVISGIFIFTMIVKWCCANWS